MELAPRFLPFQDPDYPTLADFLTRLHPDKPVTADTLRNFDRGRLAGEHHHRTLAWDGERLIGLAETERSRQFTRPGWFGLHVHAANPGLRQDLERRAIDGLRPLNPAVLHTSVAETWPDHAWLLARGWQEHEGTWLSVLDLTAFKPDEHAYRKARSAGTELLTLSDLGWDGSEAVQRHTYRLTVELLTDVPTTHPIEPWPFEVWRDRVVGHPDFRPDGPLIAVHGQEWIGMTELYRPVHEVPGQLMQGLTGVRRAWRGRGVAWALKLGAAERAKADGWRSVRTSNHTVNREMLGINRAMGFVRGPAQVVLKRGWTSN